MIRWATVFVDVTARDQVEAERFWSAATSTTLSPRRGETGAFVTLVPPEGDAYLRVQRVESGPGGVHLDLHADDPEELAALAVDLGAEVRYREPGLVVLASPGGLVWCAVGWRGEHRIPAAVPVVGGGVCRFDQFCIDAPADAHDRELAFWTALTKWTLSPSDLVEFHRLRDSAMPVDLLVQRLGEATGPVRGHIDAAAGPHASDVRAATTWQVSLGAVAGSRHEEWQVMTAPGGTTYCLTSRAAHLG